MFIFARKRHHFMFSIKDISEYIVLRIAAFAVQYQMTDAEAYRYLSRYGAIKVAHDFYDVMHTQPMADMVQSMATYCHRKAAENEGRASSLALPSDSRLDEVKEGHL